ncbi:hypothetical protein I316_02231 [Kwoniella heveanensis BCC8398]|uniref:Uncharacterized protein n=1 Tax=Kwoniella heveanensis BCC8398 TaxID=1296120 RepID=A0A1B9GXI2_9TREE|nr:hypothetical protein I316_02231 [Kwoniella heveanensis BCC8398]
MGNCFSDPSKPHTSKSQGQGQVLGSGSGPAPSRSDNTAAPPSSKPSSSTIGRNSAPPRTLGGGSTVGGGSGLDDPRERALRAAEERAKAAQGKGVNASNPKAGQLSAKLAAENRKVSSPNQNDERMMDKGQWN